jgi:diguanylate cyclase (GGDEF)-like protein
MIDRPTDLRAGASTVPPAFVAYALLTALGTLAAVLLFGAMHRAQIAAPELFWMLALFVLIGELLPIPVPRRRGLAKVTISSAFAFAILLRFGAGAAALVYSGSLVVADLRDRTAPIKVLFNTAQYVLAIGAAAAVLALGGVSAPVHLTGHGLPLVLAAAAAFFAANHVLACIGAALLVQLPVGRYLLDDLAFQAWTAGCLLAFAPAALASAEVTIWLVPLCFVPLVAVYIGGVQAAITSHRAYHDSLTELPNRLLLAERLQSLIATAKHERGNVAVMILDLDDFKAVNDTLGHEFGDLVLGQVANSLNGALADGAMLARLGGDEFAVVLEGGSEDARSCAEQLLAALDRPLLVESLSLRVTGSIGIACFPKHGDSVQELLRRADIALYCAKATDRGIQTYTEEQDEYTIDRLALAAQLRRGIERGELVVHYQPKVPLQGGPTNAVEALVRWNHPQLGRIGPGGFIPLAEQTGLIKRLTEHVFESALAQCNEWRRCGLHVRVSVNVSTRSLLDNELPGTIRGLLERFELDASSLQLEITESRIVTDLSSARAVLEELRAMGVTIAIDDFGTGFSSLSQLQQLPIDEIKIDRSFVTRMETDRNDAVLVRSIIDLGRNLSLRVTAEGVETESLSQTLRELGCDFGQGFHLGRPVGAEECSRYLHFNEGPTRLVLAAVAESA